MNISITPNNYKEVTECRENVVQAICDAFLDNCCWSKFHPNDNGCYRQTTDKVLIRRGKGYGFNHEPFSSDDYFKIRKCEVELAIKLLLESGYYLYRYYMYGSWITYEISRNPRLTDKTRVTEIRSSDWSGYFS